jgi:alpha-beta hydrolase superfamily lysophospholipase
VPGRRAIGRGALLALAGFALPLGLLYIAACALFWAYEPLFVFAQVQRPAIAPASLGLDGFAQIAVTAEDGARLYGWWRPPDPGRGAVVFLTGSGVSLADYAALLGDLGAHGFGIGAVDYRGNGASPGTPSEAAWRADARAVFDHVRQAAPGAKIAAFGESMGTGFAVELACDRPVAGVLLNSPYASVARLLARNGVPLMRSVPIPTGLLMRNRIDAEALIGGLRVPVLILHGTEDRTIPIAEARRLFAAAREPKEFIAVAGAGHVETWSGAARDRALAALTAWTAP